MSRSSNILPQNSYLTQESRAQFSPSAFLPRPQSTVKPSTWAKGLYQLPNTVVTGIEEALTEAHQ